MSKYELYCRGESGNCYKVALMLNLIGADWSPRLVGFFDDAGKAAFGATTNEMAELPALRIDGQRVLSQSGAILDYLARTSGRFLPRGDEEHYEVLRWLLFDNHRFTPAFASLRFMVAMRGAQESVLTEHLRKQAQAAYEIVDRHLATRDFMVGDTPTIADISMAGYLYYDEDAGFDRSRFRHIQDWAGRIRALPGWEHPYRLMPRASGAIHPAPLP